MKRKVSRNRELWPFKYIFTSCYLTPSFPADLPPSTRLNHIFIERYQAKVQIVFFSLQLLSINYTFLKKTKMKTKTNKKTPTRLFCCLKWVFHVIRVKGVLLSMVFQKQMMAFSSLVFGSRLTFIFINLSMFSKKCKLRNKGNISHLSANQIIKILKFLALIILCTNPLRIHLFFFF